MLLCSIWSPLTSSSSCAGFLGAEARCLPHRMRAFSAHLFGFDDCFPAENLCNESSPTLDVPFDRGLGHNGGDGFACRVAAGQLGQLL